MKSITLRDKLGTAIKCRIDDLSFAQAYSIIFAVRDRIKKIEENINYEKDYRENHKDDEKALKQSADYTEFYEKELDNYKEILQVLESDTTVLVDCYSNQAEKMSFDSIRKKYKKI